MNNFSKLNGTLKSYQGKKGISNCFTSTELHLISFLSLVHRMFQRLILKVIVTAQKMKFFITDFFSKCDQIRRRNLQWKTSFFVQWVYFFFAWKTPCSDLLLQFEHNGTFMELILFKDWPYSSYCHFWLRFKFAFRKS